MDEAHVQRVLLRRVALRALLVALLAALLMLAGEELPREPLVVALLGLCAAAAGASVVPVAWIELGALVRRQPVSELRLGLAALGTVALAPSVAAQAAWSGTFVETGSGDDAWAAVSDLPARMADDPPLALAVLGLAVLWPFLLLGVSLARLRLLPGLFRFNFYLLFFPTSLVLVGLAAAIDALDARLFGPPPEPEQAPEPPVIAPPAAT